jgi:hypothetical protein
VTARAGASWRVSLSKRLRHKIVMPFPTDLTISHQGGLVGDDAVILLAPVPAQQWFFNDMCLMRWYLLLSNLPLANHR